MSKIIIFSLLTLLLSPVAMSSEILSSPVIYGDSNKTLSPSNGFDIKIKSGSSDESLIGTIMVSEPSEIEKKSSSPIYSTKISFVGVREDTVLFYVDFSTKNSREIDGRTFETYFFIRDVVEVNGVRGSRFNVGNNTIIFSPI